MDPYLERMVLPAIDSFRNYARAVQRDETSSSSAASAIPTAHLVPNEAVSIPSLSRLKRLSELIYRYTQVRGRKTIGKGFQTYLQTFPTSTLGTSVLNILSSR